MMTEEIVNNESVGPPVPTMIMLVVQKGCTIYLGSVKGRTIAWTYICHSLISLVSN